MNIKNSCDVMHLLISVYNFSVSSADLISHKHLVSSTKIKEIANWRYLGIKMTNNKGLRALPYYIDPKESHQL